ncbi:MAG: choice-of-anchor J domain-containing protein [Bacteroidales bacterium]|nr:choice-of-anchor J domain-containing protein [Bacteroidales bacterium]
MKKFTILIIAMLIAIMGFTQTRLLFNPASNASKETAAQTNTRAVTGTLQLSDPYYGGNIGTNGGTCVAAARFESSQLTGYVGQHITKISVYIADASVITASKVAILTGSTSYPVIAMQQTCTFVDGLNIIELETPYQIPAATPIMIAYEITSTGGYPLGTDAGPAVTNGDLVCLGSLGNSLVSMSSNYSLNYNFIISATVDIRPIINVNPTTMTFVGFTGNASTEAQEATIQTQYITSNINIRTAAPFQVSSDNTNFGASATLTEDGSFYVRYIPSNTEIINDTGYVTISTHGAEDQTIELIASTYDCSQIITTFPYEEGFENGITPCWTLIDADGDGNNWDITYDTTNTYVHGGTNAVLSTSYNGSAINANNWIITPAIVIPTTGYYKATWYAKNYSSTYPDTYNVYIGTEPTVVNMQESGPVVTHIPDTEWEKKDVLLNAYAGQTIYIGFNHNDYDEYYIFIDDFSITEVPANEIAVSDLYFGTESGCGIESSTISAVVTNNGGAPLTSFTATYKVNGGEPVSETFDVDLTFQESYSFTFTTPMTMDEIGEYNVVVYVTLQGDQDHSNDTIYGTIEKMTPEIELASVSPDEGSAFALRGQSINITGTIVNNGCLLSNYVVSYKVNDGEFVDDYTVYCYAEPYEYTTFTHNIPFTPEAAGEYTITVKVSLPNGVEDDADDNEMTTTITMISCDTVTTFPYVVDFEEGIPTCWYLIDYDGDGNNWTNLSTYNEDYYGEDTDEYISGYNSDNAAISVGYYYNNDNNWMITPAITVPAEGNYWASWYEAAINFRYDGSYSVYISSEPTVSSMTSHGAINTYSNTSYVWTKKTISLSEYAGQTIYIGFKHTSNSYNDPRNILIDDFMVSDIPDIDIAITDFDYVPALDCESSTIMAIVENNGYTPWSAWSSFIATYKVNNSAPVSDTIYIGRTISPGETYTFAFSTPVRFNSANEVNIKVYATMNGDSNHSNDTITGIVEKKLPEITLTSITPTDDTYHYAESINIGGTIINNSCSLTSYVVSYKIGEGNYVANYTVECDLSEGETHSFTHNIPFRPTTPGEYTVTVKVSRPNGVEDDPSDNEMTATFVLSCKLTVLSSNNNQGYVSGSGYYVLGTEATISATAYNHYYFSHWNDGDTTNNRTVIVNEEKTYIAIFATDMHTITVESEDEEMGTVSGEGTYEYGSEIQISAEPNPGYRFVSWSNGYYDNPLSVMVYGDATYTAYFEAITEYTINVYPSSEEYGTATGSGIYNEGDTITIEAIPGNGYVFTTWNDGNRYNPRTIIVSRNANYIANFAEVSNVTTYTITANSSNSTYGTVTGGGTYAAGTIITITAIANEGYQFALWSDESTENPRQIMVTEDATYEAMFEEEFTAPMYNITVISSNTSRGTVTGSGTYPEGAVIEIEAIANGGFAFSSWNDENTDNPRQITVTEDAIYVALFVPAMDIEENIAAEISLFPNPVTDILNITSSEEISSIEIVNVMGQIVTRMDVNSNNAVCDVNNLPNGVYVVRIHNMNEGIESFCQKKFVKE